MTCSDTSIFVTLYITSLVMLQEVCPRKSEAIARISKYGHSDYNRLCGETEERSS